MPARVGAAVGSRIETRAAEEVVLDELQVRVERQRLVVDDPVLRVRADHHRRDAETVAEAIDVRRADVVVEATPVVPGQEDRCALPLRAAHHVVDQPRHVGLADRDRRRRVFTLAPVRHDPRDRREVPGLRGPPERVRRLDVPDLMVMVHVLEVRQRVPDLGGGDGLRLRPAQPLAEVAVGLRTR